MKAPASILIVSSLLLATLGPGKASGETNELVRVKALATPGLSHPASQILQLAQAGMDESVITTFISTAGIFQLSVDQIVYFNDLGISSRVIQAMLMHDREKLAAASQNTNASNASMVVQPVAAPTTSVEQPTFQGLASANIQTDVKPLQAAAAVVPVASPKKKVSYPVRAPYPVELTAPIVFLDAPTF